MPEQNEKQSAPAPGDAKSVFDQFFIKTELRPEGLFLTVKRGEEKSIDIEKLKQAFEEAQVMNADLAKIEDVFRRARGIPERIGERFEFYDAKKDRYLKMDGSAMEIKLTLDSLCAADKVNISERDILYRLNRWGIVSGIDKNAVAELACKKILDAPVVVARGKDPKNGLDAHVEEIVPIDPNAKPVETASGMVDYKNIETFKQISEGEAIAVRYPATKGEDGTNVYGSPVKALPGKDVALPVGKNTKLSPDNNRLLAECGGYLYRHNGLICVGDVLVIPKDVDFSTGNIKYRGQVVIKGDVKAGFKVETEDNVVIFGNVEGAEVISRRGSVVVKNGVFGQGKSKVFAQRDIQVLFSQNADIESEQTLSVTKYLLHCNVKAANILVTAQGAHVVGGSSVATQSMKIYEAGSNKEIKTLLRLIDPGKEACEQKIKELEILEHKITLSLLPLQNRLKKMNLIVRQGETISAEARDELKKTMDEYTAASKRLEFLRAKKEEIKKKLEAPAVMTGNIAVISTVYANVTLDFYGLKKDIRAMEKERRFYVESGEIKSQKYT